jgi:hypothetical protein
VTVTVVDDDDPPVAAPETHQQPRSKLALYVTLALVATPFLVAVLSLIGRHWFPAGDQALEMLRIRDVGGRHTPLVGAWSRWGWAHPGPALFWFLAPFDRLLGANGVLVGVAVLNGASALGVVLVAYRRGGTRLAVLAGLMVALITNSLGLSLLIDPWNPWVGVLPFLFCLVASWAVVCDDLPMLPLAVLAGSFVVQAHVGFLPLVGGVLALAIVWAIVAARKHTLPNAGRWFTITGAVALLMWLPSIIQEIIGDPKNLSDLISYARHPTEKAAGWNTAFGTLGAQLAPVGSWLTNHEINILGLARTAHVWPGLLTVGVIAIAGWWAHRRGAHDAARLAVVALVATALALLATSRITGLFAPYLLRWWWAVAGLGFLAIAWSVVSAVKSETARTAISGVALVALAGLAIVSVTEWRAPFPEFEMSRALAAITAPTAAALDHNARYLVRGVDARTWDASTSGLIVQLTDRGYHAFAESASDTRLQYDSRMLSTSDKVDGIITVVAIPELDAGWVPPPGSRVVASYDPLTPAQRTRIHDLEAKIKADMGANAPQRVLADSAYARGIAVDQGASPADIEEFHQLQVIGDGFIVYLSPAP